jgi:hypothetical protein
LRRLKTEVHREPNASPVDTSRASQCLWKPHAEKKKEKKKKKKKRERESTILCTKKQHHLGPPSIKRLPPSPDLFQSL